MHSKTRLFLIGLCLISILGFNFFVVQTSALAGAVVILGIVFIAGALTGYFVAKVTTSTKYEAGVDKTDYLLDVAETWDMQLGNAKTYSKNTENLATGVRYLWFRKAEYMSQNFINETEFPFETVAEKSGVKGDFLNMTSALLDSFDNVVAMESLYFEGSLPAFDTLTAKAEWQDGIVQYELKGYDVLGVFQWFKIDSGTKITTYGYFHKFNAHKPMFIVKASADGEQDFTLKVSYLNGTVVKNWTTTINNLIKSVTFSMDYDDFVEGEKYKIELEASSEPNYMELAVPINFIPYNDSDVGKYRCCFAKTHTAGGAWSLPIEEIVYYSDGSEVKTVNPNYNADYITNAIKKLVTHYEDALDSGQTYWNYLKVLGYDDINEVPSNFKIPAPSVVDIDSGVTEKLDPEQLYALYVAYLKALENFFTSETYRNAKVGSVDVKMSDFSVFVNATAYNEAGDSTIFDKKLAILMPTTEDLFLEKGKNNTLTQTVNCVYFDNTTETEESLNYVQLHVNETLYIYDIYEDGVLSSAENVTIAIADLRQVALKYNFILVGDPTYAYTDVSAIVPVLLTVMVVMLVVEMVSKRRRRR